MKVILFGAGASKADNSNLPLTKELYPRLKEEFPETWGKIDDRYDFENDFEIAMWNYFSSLTPQKQKKVQRHCFPNPEIEKKRALLLNLAKYFIQFKLNEKESLYDKFLKKIKEKNGSYQIATLNYDTLLFQAMQLNDIGFEINGINELSKSKLTIPVCLPHGCSNIYCEGGQTPDGQIHGANGKPVELTPISSNLVSSSEIGFLEDTNAFERKLKSPMPFFPVLCHIQPYKFAMYGQNFIESQLNLWKKWADEATKILIIGVKCSCSTMSRDYVLWDALQKTHAKIMYLSGRDGEFFKKSFSELRPNQDVMHLGYWNENFDEAMNFLN